MNGFSGPSRNGALSFSHLRQNKKQKKTNFDTTYPFHILVGKQTQALGKSKRIKKDIHEKESEQRDLSYENATFPKHFGVADWGTSQLVFKWEDICLRLIQQA